MKLTSYRAEQKIGQGPKARGTRLAGLSQRKLAFYSLRSCLAFPNSCVLMILFNQSRISLSYVCVPTHKKKKKNLSLHFLN